MGEPKKLTPRIKEDKKKIAVNLGNNGGGIGVGIIFLGGALATAALVSALTVGRRLLKSKKSDHCPSTGSTETTEKFNAENSRTNADESKGLQSFPPDSSRYMHQNLSNGAAKTSTTETDTTSGISTKSFFPEEKHNLESYTGKGDIICEDSSGLHGSDCSMGCDGSFVKTAEFSLPVAEDQTLFQPANLNKDPYGGEIEIIEEDKTIEIPDVDHSKEEDSQLTQVNNAQKIGEVKCQEAAETAEAEHSALIILQSSEEQGSQLTQVNNDQKIEKEKCQEAAEIAEADHSALIMLQSSEEQESTLIDRDQDSDSMSCSLSKSNVSLDQDFLVPLLYKSSLCKNEKLKINWEEGSQAFETVETLDGDEAIKAVRVNKGQGDTTTLMLEGKEKECNQHEGWLIAETAEPLKRYETLEKLHADPGKFTGAILMFEEEERNCSQHDGLLIVQTVEVLKRDEKLDADQADEGNSGLQIVQTAAVLKRDDMLDGNQSDEGNRSDVILVFGEEEEEKFDQHNGSLTMENARGLEEDKTLEPAQGKDKIDLLMLENEIGAPHDEVTHAAGEAAELVDNIASESSSNLPRQLTEEQENPPIDFQEDNCVFDRTTSENITSENSAAHELNLSLEAVGVPSQFMPGIGFHNNLKEVELLAEASEMRKENISSEPAREDRVIESDRNPLKQSIMNTLIEIEDTSATTEADNGSITGEMQMSREDGIDDDTEEANIEDKVEENSEGTGESSVEYSTEPISAAESLVQVSIELTELKLNDQREKQQAEENKTLQAAGEMYLKNGEDRGISGGKDSSKMTFLKRFMLELAEQNDQQTKSLKPRVLDLTWIFMVLMWSLCFWYFGLPFWKMSLIVVLVILLSKIQGT